MSVIALRVNTSQGSSNLDEFPENVRTVGWLSQFWQCQDLESAYFLNRSLIDISQKIDDPISVTSNSSDVNASKKIFQMGIAHYSF